MRPQGDDSSYESYSYTSYSGESSDTEPPVSEVSDQHSMLEHAYSVARDAFKVTEDGTLEGEEASLNVMGIFPPNWPLAKMTLPVAFGSSCPFGSKSSIRLTKRVPRVLG